MATTLEAMQAKVKKLQAQADALIAKQSSGVIEKIRELMAKHGLTAADIYAHVGSKRRATKAVVKTMSKGSVAVVKYRDPKSSATWTGHGRAPSWIAAAKNRDKFLVDGSTATAKPAPASKAKAAGNFVRGPQPAMYQNPKSGATWSGRGRAPAWIAEAKDRSKFLIASGAEATVAANAGGTSKAKTAVKKTPKAIGATSTKGQPKGPQPAKYRDPKSGATWSGRGPAPAWLAGAKDRAKFLIASVSGVADSGAASKPKVVAKKPAIKAAVAKKAPAKKLVGAKKVGTTTNVAAAPEAAAA
ncbi:H-NS family nucleoid-associated regulatory protein [Paraburkholderia sp. MM5477-R1]|uniref:H-NS family nucleoid-associated regulatory protein n=1 Tax=Paraburkholderia sp. MM5477-R1 TaxID=2991062 RepID=UPI003D1F1231